jgi:hypothetical protein
MCGSESLFWRAFACRKVEISILDIYFCRNTLDVYSYFGSSLFSCLREMCSHIFFMVSFFRSGICCDRGLPSPCLTEVRSYFCSTFFHLLWGVRCNHFQKPSSWITGYFLVLVSINCVVLCIVLFRFCCSMYCLCVNVYYCHRMSTQLQLNISYHIISSYHIIYHII